MSISITFIVVGVLIFLLSIFFPEAIYRFLPTSFGQSLTERALLANSALSMIKSNFLLGVGFGNFLPSLPFFSGQDIVLQPVHNIYLLIASELGLFGATFFLWFLWHSGWQLWKETNKEKRLMLPLFLAFTTILLTGLFDHYWLTLQQGQLIFALVVGLVLREFRSVRGTIKQ